MKVRKYISIILLAAAISILTAFTALAAGKGSITISALKDKRLDSTVTGLQVSLYKIADFEPAGMKYSIPADSPFAKADPSITAESLEKIKTAAEMEEMASRLMKLAKDNDIKALKVQKTSKKGVTFTDLEEGLYMVVYQDHVYLTQTNPAMIRIPEVSAKDALKLEYDISVNPKAEYRSRGGGGSGDDDDDGGETPPETTPHETTPTETTPTETTPTETTVPGSTPEETTPTETEQTTPPDETSTEYVPPTDPDGNRIYETNPDGSVRGVHRDRFGRWIDDETGEVIPASRIRGAARTGDNSMMTVFAVLGLLAAAGLAGWGIIWLRRRKDQS